MKANELRELSVEELGKKQVELNEEFFNLRFQLHTGHLENTSRVVQIRREIARVKTILRQKRG